MADSRRQQIITALDTLLKTILKSRLYETDIGLSVFRHRTEDWQVSELPGVDLRDGEEIVTVRGQNHVYDIDIELEIKTVGDTAETVNRAAIADVQKAIGVDLAVGLGFLGGLAQKITPVSNGSFDFDKKDKKIGSSTMSMTIQYITKAFQPFS